MFKVYEEIFQRVAALICGTDAGQLSVYQAITHFAENREQSHAVSSPSSRIEPIIQTIIKSKKKYLANQNSSRFLVCLFH